MCIDCLKKDIKFIDERVTDLEEFIGSNDCDCCKEYAKFVLGIYQDLKFLCLTKVKKSKSVCNKKFLSLINMEQNLRLKVQDKLNYAIDNIYDCKEEMTDEKYVDKMDNIKCLNDLLESIYTTDTN